MTRYTVVWDAAVENTLANAWILGDSEMRSTLAAIADWVDRTLAEAPELKGQPISERSARTIDVPLSTSSAQVEAIYQVFPQDRLVRLIQLIFRIV